MAKYRRKARKKLEEADEALKLLYRIAPSAEDYQYDLTDLGPSAFEGIEEDPVLRQAQVDAMNSLLADAQAGGLSAGDLARIEEANIQGARQERAQRDALAQQFASRGQGGSGFNQAQALLNSQGGADQRAAQQRAITSQAEQLALQKMLQGQQIAGGIRQDDYAKEANRAQAADLINQYNNNLANQQAQINQQAQLQPFQNMFNITSARAGGLQNAANLYNDISRQRGQNVGQGLQAAGNAAGTVMKMVGMGCHGAAEYYEWGSPEWLRARDWIHNGWPKVSTVGKVFKAFYSKYSKQVAWVIRKSKVIKEALRPFFKWCVENGR